MSAEGHLLLAKRIDTVTGAFHTKKYFAWLRNRVVASAWAFSAVNCKTVPTVKRHGFVNF
jgi:hypothetical protein